MHALTRRVASTRHTRTSCRSRQEAKNGRSRPSLASHTASVTLPRRSGPKLQARFPGMSRNVAVQFQGKRRD